MREGFDNEIDSLLRRTARAPAGARGNGAGAPARASHPDADELAAFAEGALPEPARVNAVSHLADCEECRTLVVGLSRAAGVEAKLDKRAAAASPAREPKPSRGWLAAVFAPRTLRYVVPALAVCLVAAVSFFALRTREGRELLSQRTQSSNADTRVGITSDESRQTGVLTPSDEPANANSSANANTNVAPGAPGPAGTTANTAAPSQKDKGAEGGAAVGEGAPAPVEAKSGDAAATPPPPAASKAKEEETAARDEPSQPAPAKAAPAESAPAPKPVENTKAGPPPAANDDVASNVQEQKRGAQTRNLENVSPDGSRAQQRSAANNSTSGGAYGGLSRSESDARSRRDAEPSTRRGRSSQDSAPAEAERSAETRSVAGHRFRREGGAWVDVKYKSSMSSTGVRRGTDAYRALVADFPDIGRVAEQLGGEVVVVVSGRAYRIR